MGFFGPSISTDFQFRELKLSALTNNIQKTMMTKFGRNWTSPAPVRRLFVRVEDTSPYNTINQFWINFSAFSTHIRTLSLRGLYRQSKTVNLSKGGRGVINPCRLSSRLTRLPTDSSQTPCKLSQLFSCELL